MTTSRQVPIRFAFRSSTLILMACRSRSGAKSLGSLARDTHVSSSHSNGLKVALLTHPWVA